MHWTDSFIGRPYIPGVADCASLAEDVARTVLKIDPGLPLVHETTLRGQAKQLATLKDSFALRADTPADAQPVLFIARGRFYHCGAIALIGGETYVLHNDQSAGRVICQRLRDMTRWAYQFEGFYRWLATK